MNGEKNFWQSYLETDIPLGKKATKISLFDVDFEIPLDPGSSAISVPLKKLSDKEMECFRKGLETFYVRSQNKTHQIGAIKSIVFSRVRERMLHLRIEYFVVIPD